MSRQSRPRVLLADAQPALRRSIRGILEQDGFAVCAEAGDTDEALAAAVRHRPELCLVDVLLPGNGVRAIREISRHFDRTTVVVLTSSRDHDLLVDAIRAGAAGYLLKDMNPDRLPHALRGVLAGEAAIPRPLVAQLVKALQTHGRRRAVVGEAGAVELTAREWEVLELLCDGARVKDIAGRLVVSEVTVRRHISAAVKKLGVANRDQAIALIEESR